MSMTECSEFLLETQIHTTGRSIYPEEEEDNICINQFFSTYLE